MVGKIVAVEVVVEDNWTQTTLDSFFDGYLLAGPTLDDYHLTGGCIGIAAAVENRKRLGSYSLGYIGYVVVVEDYMDVDLVDFDTNIALVVVDVAAVGQNPLGIRSMADYKIASVAVVDENCSSN